MMSRRSSRAIKMSTPSTLACANAAFAAAVSVAPLSDAVVTTTISFPVCALKLPMRALSCATVDAENIPAWSCTKSRAAAGRAAGVAINAAALAASSRFRIAMAFMRSSTIFPSRSFPYEGRVVELYRGPGDLDCADRAEHDAAPDRALHVCACRQRHVAGIRLRRHDARFRRALHQSIRAALDGCGLDVPVRRGATG